MSSPRRREKHRKHHQSEKVNHRRSRSCPISLTQPQTRQDHSQREHQSRERSHSRSTSHSISHSTPAQHLSFSDLPSECLATLMKLTNLCSATSSPIIASPRNSTSSVASSISSTQPMSPRSRFSYPTSPSSTTTTRWRF